MGRGSRARAGAARRAVDAARRPAEAADHGGRRAPRRRRGAARIGKRGATCRAVQAFTHEAEQVIAERLANVGEVAAQRLDRRLVETDAAVGERRDIVAAALETRFATAEQELRDRLEALAADGEAARAVLEAR